MSALEGDWRKTLDVVDAKLIDGYQSGVPVERRPFRSIGDTLGVSEQEAVSRVQRLRETGVFRRFGAVLNPPVIGSSTLAAVQAPEDRFEEIATTINGYRQVNHNYRRDHEWNMWFVITAATQERRDRIIAEIETVAGDVLVLPLVTDYYIDLEFPVVNADRFARESLDQTAVSATQVSENATADLSTLDRQLLVAIQDGLPLTKTPYSDVAEMIDASTETVVARIGRLLDNGCIKRIGCVVNHVVTGFDSNCMVVWEVPTDSLDTYGERVGAIPYVTLCYHRPRRPELDWPYTLFTMIHGRDADAVEERIDELANEQLPFAHERLYSTETLKQTGARYESLLRE
ncbi:siroheme decarboxylase subunit beta [Halocatena pleomorpha]|uniref:siroheme decarboxylase n=1 Tax=Halocatena pleomorpha TaxID=1785090 RepID=A0A3P3RBZ7_9EURY|nr:Lrp/AsnC family transcriptional regulator [Halocatena pleomorpha]RRJ31002.1 Lrp/AsnC family transcriptional regulator [Halocatena pleomorpha]